MTQTMLLCEAPEVVEHVCAVPPHVHGAVFPQALVIEAVHLCQSAHPQTSAGPNRAMLTDSHSECRRRLQQPHLRDLPALMVPPDECYPVRVPDLQGRHTSSLRLMVHRVCCLDRI